mgnify:CR=1 FL=1
MNLLTPEIRAALLANMHARRNAQAQGKREPDPVPVARFFNPLGAATWLATELDEATQLGDRIAVMYRGKIVGIVPSDTPRSVLGQMMAGISA